MLSGAGIRLLRGTRPHPPESPLARRHVKWIVEGRGGEILAVGHDSEYWSPRAKVSVISDIEHDLHVYYVQAGSEQIVVEVVEGPVGKELRAPRDLVRRFADR